jgi:hypothetical protein
MRMVTWSPLASTRELASMLPISGIFNMAMPGTEPPSSGGRKEQKECASLETPSAESTRPAS